jgi:hypothetical protein
VWVIELWYVTHYGARYQGYYHATAWDHFCTNVDCAARFDKCGVDDVLTEGSAIIGFPGWNWRLIRVV